MEHGREGEWHGEKAEDFRDRADIDQAHHRADHQQVADQASEHEDNATVAAATVLQADLKHHDGRDGDDESAGRTLERICGEGRADGRFENEHGTADREDGVERELDPKAILQRLNDRIFAVHPALFPRRKSLSGQAPAFNGIQKSHCGVVFGWSQEHQGWWPAGEVNLSALRAVGNPQILCVRRLIFAVSAGESGP